MFCLDTNTVIAVLNERSPQTAERPDAEIARETPILLSTIVLYELRYGVARSARPAHNLAVLERFLQLPLTIAAFDADDAAEAGEIRAGLAKGGTPMAPYDVLIGHRRADAKRRSSHRTAASSSACRA